MSASIAVKVDERKVQRHVEELRGHFDDAVASLTQREYYEVLQGFISILGSYEDCVKEELREKGESV